MAEEGTYHKGAIADQHNADHGIRGGHMLKEPGDQGETALLKCGTSKGNFVAQLHRDWSPHGYDRATTLFSKGFYDHSHFFRVVPKFLVQFGISYTDNRSLKQYANTPIPDDPPLQPKMKFHKGTMAFAGSGPNSRTSQLFFSYGDNPGLGRELWETPFGEVVEGMEHLEALYSYGDMPPWGKGPEQPKIRNDPNYVKDQFPLLDKFTECTVEIHKPGDNNVVAAAVQDHAEATKAAAAASPERKLHEPDHHHKEYINSDAAKHQGDDLVEAEQRQLEAEAAAHKILGPFEDLIQLGLVCAGIIALVLVLAAVTRRGGKKKRYDD